MPSLWDLFVGIVVPAVGTLHRLEMGGFRIDEERRRELIEQAKRDKARAMERVMAVAQERHEIRRGRIENEINKHEEEIWALWQAVEDSTWRCPLHPKYRGKQKPRSTREGCKCAGVYQDTSRFRSEAEKHAAACRSGKAILKRIGPTFRLSSDDDWRVLLFGDPPVGLGLKPAGKRTPKKKLASVQAEDIEKLARRYPEQAILQAKIEADAADYRYHWDAKEGRFVGPLAVPTDAQGFAHTVFSSSKTRTGRLASGTDDQEEEKARESAAGNQQNIAEENRSIYVGDRPCDCIVHGDLKCVEALVVAWLAGEEEMIAAILGNGDIHADNGMLLAKTLGIQLDRSQVDVVPFPYDPKKKSFRHAGKLTHKWHYGLSAVGMEQQYGIPRRVCQKLMDAYFERWGKVAKWQRDTEAAAIEDGYMTTPFGRRFSYPRTRKRGGGWEVDREQALADGPQSIVGDMIKRMLPQAEAAFGALPHGRLLTTTHDSLTGCFCVDGVKDYDRITTTRPLGMSMLLPLKAVMEQRFPELGSKPGFGEFWCPSDWAVGHNWGKASPTNPRGLRKVKVTG